MALSKGTLLGTYEILETLGTGGMGEVYRAHDSKLGRKVAIKILPDGFTHDPERLARFEREAHLLASLNHPNIAAIYDLAEWNGTRFLVLELVPGETLAETVGRGSIPVDEALTICRQIAEALEAAHEKGIVHRDLKPANIKLTPEGKVKVLDFSLGKLSEPEGPVGSLSHSPTITGRGTMEGVILGTAAYMSPEQARGKEVDRRTDIWSFGCVVLELLTGKQAFNGETVTDLFATILKGEPDWSALPVSTPHAIRLLLRQCLQKDARRRLQHIGDARITMEDAALDIGMPAAAAVAGITRTRRPTLWIGIAAVLLVSVITLGAALVILYRSREEPRVVQFSVSPPPNTSFESGTVAPYNTVASISPDGRRLAFIVANNLIQRSLWVRSLDAVTPQSIPGTDNAASPFWSPDSRSIAFFANGRLKKVDLAGGPPQTVCDVTSLPYGGTWNRDGLILFAPAANGPLYRVASVGGEQMAVTKLSSGQTAHRSPWFLPDGRRFLYLVLGSPEIAGVYLGALDSTASKRLLAADTNAIYSPTGHLLFVRQGVLLRQPFDVKKLALFGEAAPIAESIAVSTSVGAFSVSENGVLAYWTGQIVPDMTLTWLDRSGKLIETIGSPGSYRGVDLSPDGSRLAVHRHEGNGGDIWIFESSRGPMSRLTFDPALDNSSPVWSPDGTRLVFASLRNQKWGLYVKRADGSGGEERLLENDLLTAPMAWSTDGNFIVFRFVDSKTQADEWLLPLKGDRKPMPLLHEPINELRAQISPDGKWIAYDSNETGGTEIYVRPLPSGE